ncbi:unnamed protein product, partial [Brachionus calyciflorus]
KSLEINCKTSDSLTLECNLHLISQSESNAILIDYGDCQVPYLLKTNGYMYFEHFGPTMPSNYESIVNLNFPSRASFLILNNEFKYESSLIGFEIYAKSNGSIQLAVS